MGMKQALMIVLVIGLGSAPLAGLAEEELFDTKAAAQHIEQGIERLNAKNYDAAIAEFEESAAISPEAEAYYYLGYTYYLMGRKKDGGNRSLSRENFEKAYEIDPNFTPHRPEHVVDAATPSATEPTAPSSAAPAPVQPAP